MIQLPITRPHSSTMASQAMQPRMPFSSAPSSAAMSIWTSGMSAALAAASADSYEGEFKPEMTM